MSLGRMFKEMADAQAGLLKSFRTSYSYVLVPTPKSIAVQLTRICRVLLKNPYWTEDKVAKQYPVKTDGQGRDMLFSFTRGIRCHDLSKSDVFPVLVSDDGTKSLIVKSSTCKGCEHYGIMRGPRRGTVPFCALHRDRNKTLITDTLQKAGEDVARIMGTR